MKDLNLQEWIILIALFRATCEQQSMLIGQTQRESKMIFNRWMKEGDRLLKIIEKESTPEYLEQITEAIENSINELRYNKHNQDVQSYI